MMNGKTSFPVLFSLLLTVSGFSQYRGELVSDSLVGGLGLIEILDIYDDFGLSEYQMPIDFPEVRLYKIVYRTLDGRGENLTLASGIVAIPDEPLCEFPLLAYNHGSHTYDEVVSEFTAKLNQHLIGVPFAANGYVSVLPDYLGYGATPSDHPHPYIHAKSEATCVVDALRATKELCAAIGSHLNDQLFLLGYSQGGHVTMATHRELQQFHADEFTVTASAPCSGPYDLSGILRDSLLSGGPYSNPFFIAFVTQSYQYIYQNLYDEIGEIFQSPYDSLILRMLNRAHPESSLRDSLPNPGTLMFQPEYLLAIQSDSLHPLNENIRDNDLYDWIPEAPVALVYCTEDEQIPYENALFTADYMSALGADVQAFYAGPFDHFDCTYIALTGARNWFEFYRDPCIIGTAGAPEEEKDQLDIFPNPTSGQISVTLPVNNPHPSSLQVISMYGTSVYEQALHSHQNGRTIEIDLSGLSPGVYMVRTTHDRGGKGVKVILDSGM